MGKRSNNKGKRGEREAAAALRAIGIDAERGRQYHGRPDAPDVRCGIDCLHIEVKRTERLSLYPALAQADADAGPDKFPLVLHRRNGEEWLAILRLSDLRGIARAITENGQLGEELPF